MRSPTVALIAALALSTSGCSIRSMAVRTLADALAADGDVFSSDDDPQLIREAVPFALKTHESLLARTPRHRALLVATARGFTQYAYGFIQRDAELVEETSLARSLEIRRRARRLMLRGRDYALSALDLDHRGLTHALQQGDTTRVSELEADDMAAAFWCGASWGAAIAVLKDDTELIADLPVVVALLRRVIEVDPAFERGAAHSVMMSLEAGLAGGSLERAELHFTAAIRLSDEKSAAPFVTRAETIAVSRQDRPLFLAMLDRALAIDRNADSTLRLSNILAQERARWLYDRADELFLQ